MKQFILTIIAAVTMLGVASAATCRTEDIPNVQLQDRTRFVSNPDGLLNESAVREIDALCLSLRERGLAEVVVVAVESIEPDDVFSFAHTLFEGWGVGDDKLDNGLGILLVDDQSRAMVSKACLQMRCAYACNRDICFHTSARATTRQVWLRA